MDAMNEETKENIENILDCLPEILKVILSLYNTRYKYIYIE